MLFKSTKNNARGKNIVEEPNPTIAPITSDTKVMMKNNISSANTFVFSMW
jgi:hypothetical protein